MVYSVQTNLGKSTMIIIRYMPSLRVDVGCRHGEPEATNKVEHNLADRDLGYGHTVGIVFACRE